MNRMRDHHRQGHVLRVACAILLGVWLLGALSACGAGGIAEIEVRINNISQYDFTEVSVAGQSFGDIAAGGTSDFEIVTTRFGYAALEMTVDGRKVTGQTLNMGAKRFTYEIDVVDLLAGQLAIEVLAEEDP